MEALKSKEGDGSSVRKVEKIEEVNEGEMEREEGKEGKTSHVRERNLHMMTCCIT